MQAHEFERWPRESQKRATKCITEQPRVSNLNGEDGSPELIYFLSIEIGPEHVDMTGADDFHVPGNGKHYLLRPGALHEYSSSITNTEHGSRGCGELLLHVAIHTRAKVPRLGVGGIPGDQHVLSSKQPARIFCVLLLISR